MHSPSSVTVVLLYIVKTFRVAFRLFLSRRKSAGCKSRPCQVETLLLIYLCSRWQISLHVSGVKQYSSSSSSSVSTTLTFVLSRHWAVKWFIFLQLKHLFPNAGHLSRRFSCLFQQNLHVMNSFDLGVFR